MRSIIRDAQGVVDLGVVLMIGIAFAALMVVAYIIYTVRDQLMTSGPPSATTTSTYNTTWLSIQNITTGFDDAVNLLLVAITIFILAIAITALLMLRGR
ncbi:unnamed protein product [marine sediment metagenome]|uniref:Uncharacterized protein n=1 Tax=marine sediment metagenome TaxID=412755 RepID=X1CQB1_9ZZZZ